MLQRCFRSVQDSFYDESFGKEITSVFYFQGENPNKFISYQNIEKIEMNIGLDIENIGTIAPDIGGILNDIGSILTILRANIGGGGQIFGEKPRRSSLGIFLCGAQKSEGGMPYACKAACWLG